MDNGNTYVGQPELYRHFEAECEELEPLFGDMIYENHTNEENICVDELYQSVEEMDLDVLFDEIPRESKLAREQTKAAIGGNIEASGKRLKLARLGEDSSNKAPLGWSNPSKYFPIRDKENDQQLGNLAANNRPKQLPKFRSKRALLRPKPTAGKLLPTEDAKSPEKIALSPAPESILPLTLRKTQRSKPTHPKLVKKQPKSAEVEDFRNWLFNPTTDKMEMRVEAKIGLEEHDFVNEWWAELRAGYEDCWRLYTSIAQDQEELKRRFGKGKGHARVAECQFFMLNLHDVFDQQKLYGKDETDSEELLREIDHKIGRSLAGLLSPIVRDHSAYEKSFQPSGDILFIETIKVAEPFIGRRYGATFLDSLLRSVSQGGLTVITVPSPLQYDLIHYEEFPKTNFQCDAAKVVEFFESIGFKQVSNSGYWMKRV